MARLPQKELIEITLENLAPPYPDYEYFAFCDQLPFRYTSPDFDIVNAWWLIEAATLVYADEDFVAEKFRHNAGMPEVRFFDGDATQCFVASNAHFAIVAFRGSETRLSQGDSENRRMVADWLANIDFMPAPWYPGGRVHTGFKNALQEVWCDLEDHISSLQRRGRRIWVTGHSLGAALATLAADRYGNIRGLYTFGSPRVGDRAFQERFNVNAYRFVNNSDIVTKIPPAAIYRHVGDLKFIDSGGILHEQTLPGANWADQIEEKLNNFIDALGQPRKSLGEVLIDPITDHVPTRYAIHIWNNIPMVGQLH